MTDLDSMDLSDLKDLRRDLPNAIESYDGNRRRAAVQELHDVARNHGDTLKDLVGRTVRIPRE